MNNEMNKDFSRPLTSEQLNNPPKETFVCDCDKSGLFEATKLDYLTLESR